MKKVLPSLVIILGALCGCIRPPDGVPTVKPFAVERYLGRWYEIARLDHSFERGLTDVSADYRRRDDGGIRVVNRGYDPEKKLWKEATGRAYFVRSAEEGLLKVSFFGPFFGAYNIIALDQAEYRWALVCGPNRDYLWILSRTPVLEEKVIDQLLKEALRLGFAGGEMIRVKQEELISK